MRYSVISSSLLALSLTRGTIAAPKCKASRSNVGKAVYFITNEDDNNVAALSIGADGLLSKGTTTSTGGKGGVTTDGATGAPAEKDPLASQSSLNVAGHNLFAVNAGSNTLTMFSIDPKDPTKLTMVGQPVDIPGDFPNTVAASKKNKLVCVGATGTKNGVSCAKFNNKDGIEEMDDLRPFSVDLGQTNPPTGPTNTISQVFFSGDESMLFTTVKGDPAKNNTGFLAAFPVQAEGLGCDGQRAAAGAMTIADFANQSSPNGTAVLFGTLPIPGTQNLFATDASFGGAVLSVDPSTGLADAVANQAVDGQKATCWVTISPETKTAFVTDVAKPRLVEMSVDDASIKGEVDVSSTGATGLIDLASAGNFVYALAPGVNGTKTQVVVVDVKGGSSKAKIVQAFDAGEVGASARAQGMAVLK